jgi:enoyl-CoA hydratase/carnithine racemase
VTGRSLAKEITTGGEDFDADTAQRNGWINRSVPDAELDAFTDRFPTPAASFGRPTARRDGQADPQQP